MPRASAVDDEPAPLQPLPGGRPWNVVPWPLYDDQGHRHPPRIADLDEARPALAALPHLKLVVAVGIPALTGMMRLLTLEPDVALVTVLGVPHPSPRNARQHHESRLRLTQALARGLD